MLRWPSDHTDSQIERVHSNGPGTVCLVEFGFDHVTEICTGVGHRGLTSEKLAKTRAKQAQEYLDHGAPVGEHLADQLLMPLALSAIRPASIPVKQGGSFRTGPPTEHTRTHIDIISRFLPVEFAVEPAGDKTVTIHVRPRP